MKFPCQFRIISFCKFVLLPSISFLSFGYSACIAESSAVVSLGTKAYTVSDMVDVHGIASIRKALRNKGGLEIDSSLGSVLLYSKDRSANKKTIMLHSMLKQGIPKVFAEVKTVLDEYQFPQSLQDSAYPWQIFLEKKGRAGSGMLSTQRCHAAWMGPPANIFLSQNSFLTECGSQRTKEKLQIGELNRVLVHEIAHALEFRLMGKGFPRRKRWHSEGFASWFETLNNSWSHDSLLNGYDQELLTENWQPVDFIGSRQDYARSYALIATIVERRSVQTLFAIYKAMDIKEITFEDAVEAVLGWDAKRWNTESRQWLAERPYGLGLYAG